MKHRASLMRSSVGFSLIELMVSMVIGLIVLGATITVFLSTSRTYSAAESLGRVQENIRVAFELMARDMRQAAGNPCEKNLPVYNVLKNAGVPWYTDFTTGVRGYEGAQALSGIAFGTGVADRIAGTDAIELKSAVSDGVSIISHNPTSAQFKVGTVNHGISPGDIALACDFGQVAVFQVTNAQPGTNNTIVHNDGAGTPGNCSKGLGFSTPVVCSTNGNQYAYGCYRGKFSGGGCDGDDDGTKNEAEDLWPATLAKLRMTRWYVGSDGKGGRSLYQASLRNSGGAPDVEENPIVDGVRDMRLTYLLVGGSSYVEATAVSAADWASDKVVAVKVELVLEGTDPPKIDGQTLQRDLQMVITIRNHAE